MVHPLYVSVSLSFASVNVDSFKRFEEGPRIPGSKYFDIDDICLTPDLNPNSLPHMLPTSVSTVRERVIRAVRFNSRM